MPFGTLVGHPTTLTLLARAAAAGTLPPSLLFAGPDGVGKRAAALALAQAMNCPTPVASASMPIDACGQCAVCRRIARLVHPDVTVVEPGETGAIKIDVVREEIRKSAFKPFEGRRRVIVFDQAESLVEEAQHALLKTLEEPPAGTALVLVTSQPDRLLATVRSRCPAVRFGPLPAEDVARWLMDQHGVAEPKARAIAAVSRGSLTAARAAAEQDVDAVRASAERVLTALADARDPRVRLQAAADLTGKGKGSGARERESLAIHLHSLASLIRDLGAVGTGSSAVVNADLTAWLTRLSPSFGVDRSIAAFATVTRALEALERNASPKIVADWVVVNL